jgi:hypothetical protein
MAKSNRSERVPAKMRDRYDEIVALTDAVCAEHLNTEFAQLARELRAARAPPRPSPLERGQIGNWACGVVYALGYVNFMFDKNQPYYMSAEDLCAAFGVSKRTGYNKSKLVRDTFDMVQFDPNWCLPSLMDENPLAWSIMVNGFIVDARRMPREVQEIAYQKGLIPYIPD